jgi:hypothetical protein
MNLMQLEWVNKELKWIKYELNKFLEFFILEIISWFNSQFS